MTAATARASVIRRPRLGAEIGIGLVIGFMLVAFVVSFASLLFTGNASGFLGVGAALFLSAAAVHNLIAARWSTMPGVVVLPQDATTAVVAAGLAAMLPAAASEAGPGTIVLYAGMSTAAAALVMVVLGAFRLGRLVRFIPIPVIGGFLAGTGWLLVSGGAELATAGFTWDAVRVSSLTAAVVFGSVLLVLVRFRPSVVMVPAMVSAAVILFFGVLAVTGTSLEEARHLGLLPTGLSEESQGIGSILNADWSVLGLGAGGLISVPFVATMALLLNVTALDVMRGRDADLDRELRMIGIANLATAPLGASAGYHALGPTALAFRLGVESRVVPVVAAGVCVLGAVAGPSLVGLIPAPVVGGLLVFLGLGFMVDWLIDRRRLMSGPELVVTLTIVVVVATLGLMAAVAWGMLAAVVLFVVAYSRLDPIRAIASGRERRSTVDRSPTATARLEAVADSLFLVELQGFLFFGSCHALVDRVQELAADDRAINVLIVDLHRVQGADSTALSSFSKLARVSNDMTCHLIFSGVPEQLQSPLREILGAESVSWSEVEDADQALEMAEERLLAPQESPTSGCREVFGADLWARLVGSMDRVEVDRDQLVIEHGEAGSGFIVVDTGEIITEIPTPDGGWKRVRRSGVGTVVGEMSLYRSGGRTARVRTTQPSVLYRMEEPAVADLERWDPHTAAQLHRALARTLSERVALGNDVIRSLLD